jgi:hypothetical protein
MIGEQFPLYLIDRVSWCNRLTSYQLRVGVQALVFRAQYLAFFDRKAARLETSVLLVGIT